MFPLVMTAAVDLAGLREVAKDAPASPLSSARAGRSLRAETLLERIGRNQSAQSEDPDRLS